MHNKFDYILCWSIPPVQHHMQVTQAFQSDTITEYPSCTLPVLLSSLDET